MGSFSNVKRFIPTFCMFFAVITASSCHQYKLLYNYNKENFLPVIHGALLLLLSRLARVYLQSLIRNELTLPMTVNKDRLLPLYLSAPNPRFFIPRRTWNMGRVQSTTVNWTRNELEPFCSAHRVLKPGSEAFCHGRRSCFNKRCWISKNVCAAVDG